MALSFDQFVSHLTDSGLITADEITPFVSSLPEDRRPNDGEQLARELVKQKKLTKFQAEQIYLGKGKSLVLGNYTILDKLGQGGMGMVLKARHRRMDRLVAIKVMSPTAVKTPDALKRFHREVQAAAKLRHPNIVAADDADEAKGTHFLVMEYVEGSDLSVLVKKNGPFPVDQALRCIIQAARGLEYAHKRGVVHRDIKPANLLQDREGTVKILDMGLARIDDAVGGSAEGAGLTSTGTIMGTVDYMSPEQAMDTKQADARSDIYSLGCALYYLLTGRSLYDADTIMKKLMAHQNAPIPELRHLVVPRQGLRTSLDSEPPTATSGVDGRSESESRYDSATLTALDAVFKRMVAKKSQDRPQSMTEVIALLERCLSGCDATVALQHTGSSSSTGGDSSTGNELHDFLRQNSGDAKSVSNPTVPGAVQTMAAAPSTADEATIVTTAESAATEPRTLTSVGGGTMLASRTRGPTGVPKIAIAVGSAVLLIAVLGVWSIFGGKKANDIDVPKISGGDAVSTTPPRGDQQVEVQQTRLTPYEILTSPDYEWTPPENLGPAVNTNTADQWPMLSGDGLRLVFFSHGRANRGLSESTRTRTDELFGPAQPLGEEVANDSVQGGAALSGDGLVLVFGSLRPGCSSEPDNMNLWQATRPDLSTPFSKPICLTILNSNAADENPCLSNDGLTIYFMSHRPDQGTFWMSRRASRDAEFEPPTSIELPVLPGADRYSHADGWCLSSDERVLLFAPFYHLEGQRTLNLLIFTRPNRDAKFGAPVNLDPTLNGEYVNGRPTLSADGTTLVFQSERPNDLGGTDLWMTRRVRKTKVDTPPNNAPKPAIAPFNESQAKAHQEAWAKHLGVPVEYTNSIGMKFVLIPPGEFTMGSTAAEIEAALKDFGEDTRWHEGIKSEAPQHKVILTQPIYLGVNEVKQAEYEKVMGVNPSHFAPMGMGKEAVAGLQTADHPVEQVSWNDAAEFCAKLSRQEKLKPFYFRAGETTTPLDGTGYRLPSEAEWEFACRAGTTTKYWIGDQNEDLVRAGFFFGNSGGRTHAAGELKSNPFGLSDIHGNLWEWVQDGWDATYYGQFREKPAINPNCPFSTGSQRVVRGGDWWGPESASRSSNRHGSVPTASGSTFGFRASLTVDAVKQQLSQKAATAPPPAKAPFDTAQARAHQEAWAKHLGTTVETTNSVGAKMVLIPPGEFLMGSTDEQVEAALKAADEIGADQVTKERIQKDERPQHRVVITKPFSMGATEVTIGQFKKFAAATAYQTAAEQATEQKTYLSPGYAVSDDSPAAVIAWNDAVAYCNWLSEQENLKPCYRPEANSWQLLPNKSGYRLPTEAEWEYACRAGTTTQYSHGDDHQQLAKYGWYSKNAGGRTHPVGSKSPNAFGLYDIVGNLQEWCHDFQDEKWYEKSPLNDPFGPATGSQIVLRGGEWFGPAYFCRSAYRNHHPPSNRHFVNGFRCVCVLDAPATTPTVTPTNPAAVVPIPNEAARNRAAAEFVIKKGGNVGIKPEAGSWLNVGRLDSLPKGSLVVTSFFLRFATSSKLLDVRDDEFVAIAKLSRVDNCSFDCNQLSDAALDTVATLPALSHLGLIRAKFSADGLARLKALPNLTRLDFMETNFTGMLSRFHELSRVYHLTLSYGCRLSPADIEALATSRSLRWIDLNDVPLGDDHIAALGKLTQIKTLILADTGITASGVERLVAALPNCQITSEHPVAGTTIRLLSLIDPSRDAVSIPEVTGANRWNVHPTGMNFGSDGKSGKLRLPVDVAGRDYQLFLHFERRGGTPQVEIEVPLPGGARLIRIDKQGFAQVRVKKIGQEVEISDDTDGRFQSRWRGDPTKSDGLIPYEKTRTDPKTIGLAVHGGGVQFYVVSLKFLDKPAAAPATATAPRETAPKRPGADQ